MQEEFDRLEEITEALLGPDGCPWDQKQTLSSMKKYLEEEIGELFEEIDAGDDEKTMKELADVFFNVYFMTKIASKEKRFTLKDLLTHLNEKLIRRHPHVFGDAKVETLEELHEQWDRIKLEEKSSN